MARSVYSLDKCLGDLRDYLKEIGEDEHTIIIYASDHGVMLGEHGLGGKTILYDESVRIPLTVYSPFLAKKKNRLAKRCLFRKLIYPARLS